MFSPAVKPSPQQIVVVLWVSMEESATSVQGGVRSEATGVQVFLSVAAWKLTGRHPQGTWARCSPGV